MAALTENTKITSELKQAIINEDCITGMKKLKDESVDIIICDPPYNIGKDFGNNSDNPQEYHVLQQTSDLPIFRKL